MTDPRSIDERFVLEAARIARIDLTPEQLPSVVEHLRRSAEAAQLLNEFALRVDDEPGAIWQP